MNTPKKPSTTNAKSKKCKVHPWRMCPAGEHLVRTHDLKTPISKKNPDGITIRHGHCAKNPGKKDSIYLEEIHEIAQEYFPKLKGPPSPDKLGYRNGNKYDHLIRGWTKFWNEIFKPKDLLDSNLVKALIASESGFRLKPPAQDTKGAGKARGLIQITDQARKILRSPKGELDDYLVYLDKRDMEDANASICAGIRWLFQKKKLASHRLKREASWDEAVAEYKGYLKDVVSGKNKNPKGMDVFREKLKKLKGQL